MFPRRRVWEAREEVKEDSPVLGGDDNELGTWVIESGHRRGQDALGPRVGPAAVERATGSAGPLFGAHRHLCFRDMATGAFKFVNHEGLLSASDLLATCVKL